MEYQPVRDPSEAAAMSSAEEHQRIRRLLQVGRALLAEHDTEAILDRILSEAREITGARYAALGVLDSDRAALDRFITVGIDEDTYIAIGDLPRGRGVLGVLIEDPRPLRLADVGQHPQSYGFPMGHPAMRSFLGAPVLIRGLAWGNLYLTEKEGGQEFTDDDEEAVVILAQLAATAIDNARLYEASERRREELERAVRSLEAARDIADAVTNASDLQRVLELVAKRGRALVDARSILIMLREGNDLVVVASAGHADAARGQHVPVSASTSGQVLERGRPERISDAAARLAIEPKQLGVPDARCALLVPMLNHGNGIGILAAFDRGEEREEFTDSDEQLLRTFAASAANAVAMSRSVEADRLRSMMAAADAERRHWARELHDETLQSLGALRVTLASTVGRGDASTKDDAIRQAIADVEVEIENLRGIITDLRPSMLDDLGLLPAIEALLDRRRDAGLRITSELAIPDGAELDPELETTIYRVVQEALTNVVKHARADTLHVLIDYVDGVVAIEVQDDGTGFDASAQTSGFGVAGMRERVYLAGGSLEFDSNHTGTRVRARLPVGSAADVRSRLGPDQAAS
jgi:signal transduction histidine kinase